MKVVDKKVSGQLGGVESAKTTKADAKKTRSEIADIKQSPVNNLTKVNVSEQAQAMQKAKSIASKETIDEAKVARLQKLIDEGKYKVDADAVADKLVDEHLLLTE